LAEPERDYERLLLVSLQPPISNICDWPQATMPSSSQGGANAKRSADPGIHAVTPTEECGGSEWCVYPQRRQLPRPRHRDREQKLLPVGAKKHSILACFREPQMSRHGSRGLRYVASLLLRPGMTKGETADLEGLRFTTDLAASALRTLKSATLERRALNAA
jgi:hypothetical protein